MTRSKDSGEEIDRIVTTYGQSILHLAYAYLKNRCDAEDIAQEVLVTYMGKAPRFESGTSEKSWLMRVTCNKCKDFLKTGWRKRAVPMRDDPGYLPKDSRQLIGYVFSLEEKYRIPIHLFYYEGLSIQEIARTVRCSPATVGTRLARGRQRLKALIGDDFIE